MYINGKVCGELRAYDEVPGTLAPFTVLSPLMSYTLEKIPGPHVLCATEMAWGWDEATLAMLLPSQ